MPTQTIHPERNLAMELARVTEAVSMPAGRWAATHHWDTLMSYSQVRYRQPA